MAELEYAIARVYGLRGRLLTRRGVLALLEHPEPDVRERARAAEARLARDAVALDRLFAGTRAGRVLRAITALDDGRTLKTVLRGVTRREAPARLLRLVEPTPELDQGALQELCAQRDVKGVVDLLATWRSPYAVPLLPATRELPVLETALDQHLFARALAAARREPAALMFLRTLVDLTNVMTLLKNASPFVPGGRFLAEARFRRLRALSSAELHAALAADPRLDLSAGFVDGAPHPVLLERLVQRRLRASLERAAIEQPFSVAVPLLYLLDRREEARALRLVAYGSDVGMAAADLAVLVNAGGGA